MSITKKSLVWFRDSRMVTVALTASISVLGIAACSAPVEPVVNSTGGTNQPSVTADPNSPTPTVSQGPEVIYAQETDGYTEWDGTSDIVPGVYVADPTGEATAKPESLFGHSAYFKDGAWYVFDPSKELPQYVKDVYLAPISTPAPSFNDADTNNTVMTNDLEICYIISRESVQQGGSKAYYTFGVEWVGEGGQSRDGIGNVVLEGTIDDFKLHDNSEDAVSAMKSILETRGNCRNPEIPITYTWNPNQ